MPDTRNPEYLITSPGETYRHEVRYHAPGVLFGDQWIGGADTQWGVRRLIRKHRKYLATPKKTVRVPA